MATKTKSTASTIDDSPIYHDFEPFCEWKKGEDLLILYVPEFKKEHLKVQASASGALKISGERPLEGDKGTKKSRFYKETRIPEGCDIYDINAKLCDGKFTITFPRKTPNYFSPISSSLTSQQDQRLLMQRKCVLENKKEEMIGFGRLKVAKKIVVNVGIAVMAIATIGALVFIKPETAAAASDSPLSAALVNKEE